MRQLVAIFSVIGLVAISSAQYQPNWESLDARPLPQWYDEAKIGIFIHWGVFSVPSIISEWFWYYWRTGDTTAVNFMKKNYRQDFTYADFGPMFTAEFYNPDEWADILKDAGAKYVVLTSKHHEGFTNWPSKVSFNWNSMDIGPKRDLVGELANSIRKRTKLRFGLYHSLFEWFNPIWLADTSSGFKTNTFAKTKTMPELYEIVNAYHPDVVWSDGDGGAPADKYWNSTGFLAWLYNESPVKDTVVTNDRWGGGTMCAHGGFYTCTDRYNPGHLLKHKWENCLTIDTSSWGYRRNAGSRDYMTAAQLVHEVVTTVSCGGNILINVGPTSYGKIAPIYEDRLRGLGSWLRVNGEAIYASKPWTHQNDTVTSYVWYTSKTTATDTSVYAISLQWPKDGSLVLGAVNATSGKTTVRMLGYGSNLNWISRAPEPGIVVNVPAIPADKMPCQGGWAFKIDKLN